MMSHLLLVLISLLSPQDPLKLREIPSSHPERWQPDFASVDYDVDPLLIIDGLPLSRHRYQRALISLYGTREIEDIYVMQALHAEVQRRVVEGEDPTLFEVNDADLDQALEDLLTQKRALSKEAFLEPTLLEQREIKRALTCHCLIEKLYLPDPISFELPPGTLQVLPANIAPIVKNAYQTHNPLPSLFRTTILDQIRSNLLDTKSLRYPLALHTKIVAEHAKLGNITIEPVWSKIESRLTKTMKESGLRFAILDMVLARQTRALNLLLEAEQAESAFNQEKALYEGSILPFDLAIRLRGWPSPPAYAIYRQYREGYSRSWKERADWDTFLQQQYEQGPWRRGFVDHKFRGAIGSGSRPFEGSSAQLRNELGESELLIWLNGGLSVSDLICLELDEGESREVSFFGSKEPQTFRLLQSAPPHESKPFQEVRESFEAYWLSIAFHRFVRLATASLSIEPPS